VLARWEAARWGVRGSWSPCVGLFDCGEERPDSEFFCRIAV